MLTLYHAPRSRSSRIVQLLDELGALDQVAVRIVSISRLNGPGGPSSDNPHPEGKVPLLMDGDEQIWESSAIMQFLCERFPEAGLAPMPGAPGRGAFLSWMAWYGDVLEPLMVVTASGAEHPVFHATWRDFGAVAGRLSAALETGPYLLGEGFSAADLLVASAFQWNPAAVSDVPAIRDWVARCSDRPSRARLAAYDEAALAA